MPLASPHRHPVYDAIAKEVLRAEKHGEFQSLHEAFAVLQEEVDELWDIVRQKKKDRDRDKIEEELVQIAAMAVKAMHAMDKFVGGDV